MDKSVFNPADEIIYVRESSKRHKTKSSSYSLGGVNLYFFLSLISIIIIFSLFILYDNWLYQVKYQQLYDSWDRYGGQQQKIDNLTNAVADSEAVPGDKIHLAEEIQADIKKNRQATSRIGLSPRHPELIALKKDLVKLNDRLYKLSNLEMNFVKKAKIESSEAELSTMRRMNIAIYIEELSVLSRSQESLPFRRGPLDGIRLSNIISAVKELF